VTLPKGVESAITDRDFTIATIVPSSGMTAEGAEDAAADAAIATEAASEAAAESEAEAAEGEADQAS